MPDWSTVLDFVGLYLIPGLVTGSIYALGAIGVSLLFGILRFAHFAHGDLMTLGAYLALSVVTGFGWPALAAVPWPRRRGRHHRRLTAPLPPFPPAPHHHQRHRLLRRHADDPVGGAAHLGVQSLNTNRASSGPCSSTNCVFRAAHLDRRRDGLLVWHCIFC
jgi:hypothetical protein